MSHSLEEVAAELRKTTRWFKEWLARNPVDEAGIPFYLKTGRTKIFEVSDIARIKRHMRRSEQCRLSSIGVKASGIIEEQLGRLAADVCLEVHARPKAKTSQRARLPRSKIATGKVISMAQMRS
jgi:hypothetical protein